MRTTCQRLTAIFFYNVDCHEHVEFPQSYHGLGEPGMYWSGDKQGLFCNFLFRLPEDAVLYNTESGETQIGIWLGLPCLVTPEKRAGCLTDQ